MIKEKQKKVEEKKTFVQVVAEYVRTIFLSILVATIFTTCLTVKARHDMIKNLYTNIEERQKIDEKIAKQLVSQSDFSESLATKNYAVCMRVGNLYKTAKDYKNAQKAYEIAVSRAKRGTYNHYVQLVEVLVAQEKFEEAENVIKSVTDEKNINLIKFKARSYITMGDKYYSIGKFIKAAKAYELAQFYYSRFSKRDKTITKSIQDRIVNSYTEAAGIMVKNGLNSDAVRFLKKAESYEPDNNSIKYKLAVVYSDLDPILSVKYFEKLFDKMPQNVDYGAYNKALIKSANIEDLQGNSTRAKYYRYKIHSLDLFVNNKVVYKNDIEVYLTSFKIRKFIFKYRLTGHFTFKNISASDIFRLSADFVLKDRDKVKEICTVNITDRNKPLFSNGGESNDVEVKFGKNIFTRKELSKYTMDIYIYKDPKFKTFLGNYKIPSKTFKSDIEKLLLFDF